MAPAEILIREKGVPCINHNCNAFQGSCAPVSLSLAGFLRGSYFPVSFSLAGFLRVSYILVNSEPCWLYPNFSFPVNISLCLLSPKFSFLCGKPPPCFSAPFSNARTETNDLDVDWRKLDPLTENSPNAFTDSLDGKKQGKRNKIPAFWKTPYHVIEIMCFLFLEYNLIILSFLISVVPCAVCCACFLGVRNEKVGVTTEIRRRVPTRG